MAENPINSEHPAFMQPDGKLDPAVMQRFAQLVQRQAASGNNDVGALVEACTSELFNQHLRTEVAAESGLKILQDLHKAMSQEQDKVLVFAARVLDANNAAATEAGDVLLEPYTGLRWSVADTVVHKTTRRKIKTDHMAIGTRSDLRRYFIQLLNRRREVEKMMVLTEGSVQTNRAQRQVLVQQLQKCTHELYAVGRQILAQTPVKKAPTTAAAPATTGEKPKAGGKTKRTDIIV